MLPADMTWQKNRLFSRRTGIHKAVAIPHNELIQNRSTCMSQVTLDIATLDDLERIRSLGFPLLQSIGKMILEDNLKYPNIVTSAKFTMFGCEWCLSC